MIPHGDRRDGAESRGVEDDEVVTEREYDVVCVFVLGDNLEDLERRCGAARPGEDIAECEQRVEIGGCSRNDS